MNYSASRSGCRHLIVSGAGCSVRAREGLRKDGRELPSHVRLREASIGVRMSRATTCPCPIIQIKLASCHSTFSVGQRCNH